MQSLEFQVWSHINQSFGKHRHSSLFFLFVIRFSCNIWDAKQERVKCCHPQTSNTQAQGSPAGGSNHTLTKHRKQKIERSEIKIIKPKLQIKFFPSSHPLEAARSQCICTGCKSGHKLALQLWDSSKLSQQLAERNLGWVI